MGESFGIHRALDTVGALIGPILAFALLSIATGAYDSVFVVSFCVALVGLGVLVFFVQNPPKERLDAARARALTKHGTRQLMANKAFRRIAVAGATLSLVTISDAFIYLSYQKQTDMVSRFFPLLFVGTALAYLLRAAGPGSGFLSVAMILGLLGTYYAATDGVLMAMGSAVIPDELRSSGLAWLTTVTTAAKFAASLLFGLVWKFEGPGRAVSWFLAGIVVVLPVAVLILFRPSSRREVPAR